MMWCFSKHRICLHGAVLKHRYNYTWFSVQNLTSVCACVSYSVLYKFTILLKVLTAEKQQNSEMKCGIYFSVPYCTKNLCKLHQEFMQGSCRNSTHFAMLMKPHEAVACKGVQPSLSPLLTSAPFSTKNSTISRLSSMHACNKQITH